MSRVDRSLASASAAAAPHPTDVLDISSLVLHAHHRNQELKVENQHLRSVIEKQARSLAQARAETTHYQQRAELAEGQKWRALERIDRSEGKAYTLSGLVLLVHRLSLRAHSQVARAFRSWSRIPLEVSGVVVSNVPALTRHSPTHHPPRGRARRAAGVAERAPGPETPRPRDGAARPERGQHEAPERVGGGEEARG